MSKILNWYSETLEMTPNQIEDVLNIFQKRRNNLDKPVYLECIKYILEHYILTDCKVTQISIGRKFNLGREGIRVRIARVFRVCKQVCK